MKGLIWIGLGLIVAFGGCLVLGPRISGQFGWPAWLAYGFVFIDLAIVCAIPFTWRETTSNIALARHRISIGRELTDYPPGCAYLLILVFVVAPIAALAWLLYIAFV